MSALAERLFRVQALLFDMDGVVIDSEPLHEQAQRDVFASCGLDVPDAAFASFKGRIEEDVMAQVIADFAEGPLDVTELVEKKNAAFRALLPSVALVDGAEMLIEHASRRYRLALTTSSEREDVRIVFEQHDLRRFFDVLVTAEDVTQPKPHPQPYLVTCRHLGLPPDRCLVVEDSVHGVRSGVAAGCIVAGLTTTFDRERLEAAGAHLVVDTLATLAVRLGLA